MSLSVRGEETILDLAALNRNIGKARVVYDSEGGERERVDLARAKRRKKEEEENALKEPHPLHVHDDTTMSFGAAAVRNEVTHDHEPMSLETDPVLSASESDLNKLYAMRLRQHHIAEIGEIPETDVTKSIHTLNITGNYLTHIPQGALKAFIHLDTLLLASNRLESIPDFSQDCPNLRVLHLSHNSIENIPSSMNEMKKLEILDLRANRLSVLENVHGCMSLQTLSASCNVVSKLVLPPQRESGGQDIMMGETSESALITPAHGEENRKHGDVVGATSQSHHNKRKLCDGAEARAEVGSSLHSKWSTCSTVAPVLNGDSVYDRRRTLKELYLMCNDLSDVEEVIAWINIMAPDLERVMIGKNMFPEHERVVRRRVVAACPQLKWINLKYVSQTDRTAAKAYCK